MQMTEKFNRNKKILHLKNSKQRNYMKWMQVIGIYARLIGSDIDLRVNINVRGMSGIICAKEQSHKRTKE